MTAICATPWQLRLLGCWQLKSFGEPVQVTVRQQRLIAALALNGPQQRRLLASVLWPTSSEAQGAGNLRVAVWHITHCLPGLLIPTHDSLSLHPEVDVDWHTLQKRLAHLESDWDGLPEASDITAICHAALLPGWYDDWVVTEQERLHQQRIDALETMAQRLLDAGDARHAIVAARAAADVEPLRESPCRLLIQGHLLTGNYYSAVRVYEEFRSRLWAELAVEPSPGMRQLLAPILGNVYQDNARVTLK